MTDYYLEHPQALENQPKRSIAEYVESNGLLVPRRFVSLEKSLNSGQRIIARSEHSQDYNGVSGMVYSPTLKEGIEDEAAIRDFAFKRSHDFFQDQDHIVQYCSLLGLNHRKFKREITFSYWQHLDGYNRAIVADSAISERYHIMTSRRKKRVNPLYNYTIVEKGIAAHGGGSVLPPKLKDELSSLIEFYETVRHLPRFDANHCPIMEFQTGQRYTYFLQYHRTRDFQPAPFSVEKPSGKKWLEAFFVRGITPPDGIHCDLTIAPINQTGKRSERDLTTWNLPHSEDSFFPCTAPTMYEEIMAKRRRVQITHTPSLKMDLEDLASQGHILRSIIFKPEISVIIPSYKIFSQREYRQSWKKAEKTGCDQSIPIHLISDGRTAYLRRE